MNHSILITGVIQRQARNDSLKKPLTQQQISDRVARQEIIQQAVKNGTYDDPAKPWNKKSRWIEDGGHEY